MSKFCRYNKNQSMEMAKKCDIIKSDNRGAYAQKVCQSPKSELYYQVQHCIKNDSSYKSML